MQQRVKRRKVIGQSVGHMQFEEELIWTIAIAIIALYSSLINCN